MGLGVTHFLHWLGFVLCAGLLLVLPRSTLVACRSVSWSQDGQEWTLVPRQEPVRSLRDITDGVYFVELAETRRSVCKAVPGRVLVCPSVLWALVANGRNHFLSLILSCRCRVSGLLQQDVYHVPVSITNGRARASWGQFLHDVEAVVCARCGLGAVLGHDAELREPFGEKKGEVPGVDEHAVWRRAVQGHVCDPAIWVGGGAGGNERHVSRVEQPTGLACDAVKQVTRFLPPDGGKQAGAVLAIPGRGAARGQCLWSLQLPSSPSLGNTTRGS
jgi:hypothetical protein